MNQVFVAIYTSLLIPGPGIYDIPVGEHGPPFIRDIQDIAMAFLALFILERGIGCQPVFLMIVFVLSKMNDDVLYTVSGLGIEKVEGVMGRRQVAIHTVRHKALLIIGVSRGFPCIIGKSDFVAPCAELRGGCAHHGEIGYAEKREGQNDANTNENGWFYGLFPGGLCALRSIFRFFHVFSQNG